jgi:hypothetical protein
MAKGRNRRDQNHARQVSVASAPVGRTVCDAVHNRLQARSTAADQTSFTRHQVTGDAAARTPPGSIDGIWPRVKLSLTIFKQLAGEIGGVDSSQTEGRMT